MQTSHSLLSWSKFFSPVISGLMYLSQTQGQEGASSVRKTLADRSPPTRTLHGVGGIGDYSHGRTCMFLYIIFKPFSHPSKIQKGVSSARSDDTKSLKGVVLDWILPRDRADDTPSTPRPLPLSRNVKTNRGFHHPVTGALLCPAGFNYNDPEQVSYLHSLIRLDLLSLI